MTEQSYKILAAKRLAIDPAELLNYYELSEHAVATTPDGKEHIFSFAELRYSATHVAKKAEASVLSRSDTASAEAPAAPQPANNVAPVITTKSKTGAKRKS